MTSRRKVLAACGAMALAVVAAAGIALASRSDLAHNRPGGSAGLHLQLNEPAQAPKPPAHGAYFGAYVQPKFFSQQEKIDAVDALQRQIGRRLDIVHTYLTWHKPFPKPSDLAFVRNGSMMLLSWAGTDTRQIISGTWDNWIRQRAREIKALRNPTFLEWRWEMNRPNLSSQVHSPADYIAAWDHIRSIFAQEKVNNVAWVWCPTSSGFSDGTAQAFYPGNKEVDWICADIYPRYAHFQTFDEVVQPFLRWASYHPKPVMIGEYGVPGNYSKQQRAQWLSAAAQVVQGNPQVKAFVYFDAGASGQDSSPSYSYSLAPGSPALRVFREIADRRHFNPRGLTVTGG